MSVETIGPTGAEQSVNNARRYYLLKAQWHAQTIEGAGLAAAFLAKQQAVTGTALPADTPALTQLAAAHYTTIEDLTGATLDELVAQGLSMQQARAALQSL